MQDTNGAQESTGDERSHRMRAADAILQHAAGDARAELGRQLRRGILVDRAELIRLAVAAVEPQRACLTASMRTHRRETTSELPQADHRSPHCSRPECAVVVAEYGLEECAAAILRARRDDDEAVRPLRKGS